MRENIGSLRCKKVVLRYCSIIENSCNDQREMVLMNIRIIFIDKVKLPPLLFHICRIHSVDERKREIHIDEQEKITRTSQQQ